MKQLRKKNVMYRFLMMLFMVCVSMTASAQKAKITGTVRDLGGEPLIGVSVRADKTGQGVVTDIDGNFAVEVPSKSTLTFSYRSILLRYMLMGRTLTTRLIRRHT